MKKLLFGSDKNNLVSGLTISLIISLTAAVPFIITLSSFAVAPTPLTPPPPIAQFCSTYKQTNISAANCNALVGKLKSQDVTLLQDQVFLSAMLASFNATSIARASTHFTKECNAFPTLFTPTTTPVASCTKQAENFALFLNKIDPGNTWPTQSLKTLAEAKSLVSGTNKIADPKHFVSQANSFNHGLKTILLTGVNPVTDKTDITGFIGALWIYQSNA